MNEVAEECSQRVLQNELKRERTCKFSRSAGKGVEMSKLGAGETALVKAHNYHVISAYKRTRGSFKGRNSKRSDVF